MTRDWPEGALSSGSFSPKRPRWWSWSECEELVLVLLPNRVVGGEVAGLRGSLHQVLEQRIESLHDVEQLPKQAIPSPEEGK